MEDVYLQALKYCMETGMASVSHIQSRFPIGYIKSCKIIDWMESRGFISCGQNGEQKVIITQEEFNKLMEQTKIEQISTEETYKEVEEKVDKDAKPTQPNIHKIKIFGVGAAGCNIVNLLRKNKDIVAEFYLVNDDPNKLWEFETINKIWVGAEPHDEHTFEYGKKAGIEFRKDIEQAVYQADMVIVVAGIGGGIGSGTSAAITEIARENKIHTVAVVSTPFSFEGKRRLLNAEEGLNELKAKADTTIVVPCDKVKEIVPSSTPLRDALGIVENTVLEVLSTLINSLNYLAVANLDFVEILSILQKSNNTYFGTGIADGNERVIEAVRCALNYPLAETKFENVKGAILYIEGGDDLTADETIDIATYVRTASDSSCNIMFATNIDSKLTGKIKVSVLAAKSATIEEVVKVSDENLNTKSSCCGTISDSENRSDELNMILKAAEGAAKKYGSSYVASEHLIHAMLDNECLAGKILKTCKINIAKYVEYFKRSIDSRANIKGYTPRTKYMVEQTETFARDIDGENAIAGTEHLLLAILSSPECLAMRILKAIGVNLANLASTLEKVLRTND